MEILLPLSKNRPRLKAALFDFDGTISTLRHGWEETMEPFMVESIAGPTSIDGPLVAEVRAYIDQSTGIQTYFQMEWLSAAVKRHGRNPGAPEDPWAYKAEYNRRLMQQVEERKARILDGRALRSDFLVPGVEAFVKALAERCVEIHVASGTDDPDVKEEASILGLTGCFKTMTGAPVGRADCSKEAVVRGLIEKKGLLGPEVLMVGDGLVEISLGREAGAITLGVASDERARQGIDPAKHRRLVKAGAHAIVDGFEDFEGILSWLGL